MTMFPLTFCLWLPLLVAAVTAHNNIYKSRVQAKVSWLSTTSDATTLSRSQLDAWSSWMASRIPPELSVNDVEYLDLQVEVVDFQRSKNATVQDQEYTTMQSILTLYYVSHDALSEVMLQQLWVSVDLAYGIQQPQVEPQATNVLVQFSTVGTDELYAMDTSTVESSADRGLVAACVFLVLALLLVTSVVLYLAGAWPIIFEACGKVWSQVLDYCTRHVCATTKTRGDAAEDHVTTASGILGAQPSYDDEENRLPPGFTPNRGVFRNQDVDDSDLFTSPISTNTDYTSGSKAVPLGISQADNKIHYRSPEKTIKSKKELTYT